MANSYSDMTGVLVLNKVTPVIQALFGAFALDARYPGDGQAYIANISEGNDCRWEHVLGGLDDLIEQLGLHDATTDDEQPGSMEHALLVLSRHFHATDNEALDQLIERVAFADDDADLLSLFTIAQAFDDGHGLTAVKTETAWHCSKPRLFEFGGAGQYHGRHFTFEVSSQQAAHHGDAIDAALAGGATDAAAAEVHRMLENILTGIHGETTRADVRQKLAGLLKA